MTMLITARLDVDPGMPAFFRLPPAPLPVEVLPAQPTGDINPDTVTVPQTADYIKNL